MKRAVGGFVAGVLLTCVGCSLSLDPDQFAPPREGLLPPSVALAPNPATAAENLVATVQDPVSDEYRFSWTRTRGGVQETVGIESATVPATDLRKGDRWEVRVTPVSDGEEGYPATVDTTIQNAPPELTTAALSTYRPIAADEVTGSVGLVIDADLERDPMQESIGYHFEWFRVRDETVTSLVALNVGSGVHTLDLSDYEDELDPGDQITLRVIASDEDQAKSAVEVGPAEIIEPGTQWVQLLPDRTHVLGAYAYDSQHRRVLLFEGETLWEYGLDSRRFAQLHPTGVPPPPAAGGIRRLFADPDDGRMVVVQPELEDFDMNVYMLDISRRGSEGWVALDATGDSGVPAARSNEIAYHDVPNKRLYVWGGFPITGGPPGDPDLWMLNLVPGQEEWIRLELVGEPAPSAVYGGSFLAHPSEDRVVWLGGVVAPTETDPASFGSVYEIDLRPHTSPDDQTRTFARVSVDGEPILLDPLPVGPVAFTDREHAQAVFGLGSVFNESGFSKNSSMWEYDFSTRSTRPISVNGDADTGFVSSVERDTRSGDYVVVSGLSEATAQTSFSAWRVDLGLGEASWSPIQRYGVDFPPALAGAAVGGTTGFPNGGSAFDQFSIDMFGGESGDGKARDQVWVYELESRRWHVPPQRPDPLTMRLPGPRTGFNVLFDSHFTSFFGGIVEAGPPAVPAESNAWVGYFDSNAREYQWAEAVMSPDSPEDLRPDATHGAAGMRIGTGVIVVGGSGNGGTTRFLSCADALFVNCGWVNLVSDGGDLPLTTNAAVGLVQGRFVAFGGSLVELHELDLFGDPEPWVQVTNFTPGPRPASRVGPRFVSLETFKLTLVGGTPSGGSLDLWNLDRSGFEYTWSELNVGGTAPRARQDHAVWVESTTGQRRMLVYGGTNGSEYLSDMWELRLED